MKKLILITAMFFHQVEVVLADCQSDRDKADRACDPSQLDDAKQILATGANALTTKDKGAAKTATDAQADTTASQQKANAFVAACRSARSSCNSSCQGESAQKYSQQDQAGGQRADQNKNYCDNGKPKENQEAAEKSSMDMGQMLQALAALLAALGQNKSDEQTQEDCKTNPDLPSCSVDKAAGGSGAVLTQGTPRQSSGGDFLDAGLNGNDIPAQGQNVAPSLSQGSPMSGGGGSGMGAAGGGGYGSGRSSRNAESNPDGTPKINLAGGSGGGGRGGGGAMGPSSSGAKGSGNPVGGRVAIEGDTRAMAAMEKAMQNRGLASGGPIGGISAAHAMDNFKKVELRMQSERNLLNEL